MFHIAHKKDDEDLLNQYHMKIQEENIPDQLCLAAIHYLRSHFEEVFPYTSLY
jgi:intraflagellar transport protein 56